MCVCVCVRVCVYCTPFFANKMPRVVMYCRFHGLLALVAVESQQPLNIHTAEVHLHIKGLCSAKSSWSEYLSLSVPLSLSLYVSCLSLAFQFPPHPPQLFCSNPLLLKASLSFLLCSLFIPSPIPVKLWEEKMQRTAHILCFCGEEDTSPLNLFNKQMYVKAEIKKTNATTSQLLHTATTAVAVWK